MKILYIITLSELGGAQVHLLELVLSMKKRRIVHVIVGGKGWLTDRFEEHDIGYTVVDSLVRNVSPTKDWQALGEIRMIIRGNLPDLVHCHSSKAGIVGRVAARMENVPSVFTAHGWAFTEGVPFIKRIIYSVIEHMMLGITDKIICVSEYDKRLAEKWFGHKSDKLVCIHNGIAEADCMSSGKNAGLNGKVNIVMVGRFSVPKQHLELVKAVEAVNAAYPNSICLSLVGDGVLFSETEKYVQEHNMGAYVKLLGSRNDVDDILSKNHVFALISDYEGLPISILEAMRNGMPVIASDVGGVCELVQDGLNGFLIKKGNQNQLAEKMLVFMKDKTKILVMGRKSRERYKKEFTADMMLNKIERIYKSVLN